MKPALLGCTCAIEFDENEMITTEDLAVAKF